MIFVFTDERTQACCGFKCSAALCTESQFDESTALINQSAGKQAGGKQLSALRVSAR